MAITTTVSWDDLKAAQRADLEDIDESYQELTALAHDKYGDDALQIPTPDDLESIDDDETLRLAAIQRQAMMYDRSRQSLEKRINVLEFLADELGDDPFELKMLSGQEVMTVETKLRADSKSNDWDSQTLQFIRNQRTVDAAVVDGPEDIPSEDGTLDISGSCPNALVDSLYEQVERFNSAGESDFRPEGFGNHIGSGPSASSGTPTPSNISSEDSAPSDADAPAPGKES